MTSTVVMARLWYKEKITGRVALGMAIIIIGGAGLGSFIMANPPSVLKATMAASLALLKPNPFNKKSYGELLQVLYEVFQTARKDGLIALEAHIEEPEKSSIFTK